MIVALYRQLQNWTTTTFVVALLTLTLTSCTTQKEKLESKTIFKVNDTSLKVKDFADQLSRKLGHLDALSAKNNRAIDIAKEDILNSFTIKVVTKDWAKKNNLYVKREDLEGEINRHRGAYPDDLAFRRALLDEGLSFNLWKEKLEFSLLQSIVTKKLGESAEAFSSKELKAFFESNKKQFKQKARVKIRQIVLDSENNAKRVMRELRKGKSLKEMAKKFSVAPESKNGGDIGWIEKGSFETFDSAFNMRVGQRSSIKKSPYGYHIFVVEGKKSAKSLSFESAKAKIKKQLEEDRQQKLYSSWLEEQLRLSRVFKDEALIKNIKVSTRGITK